MYYMLSSNNRNFDDLKQLVIKLSDIKERTLINQTTQTTALLSVSAALSMSRMIMYQTARGTGMTIGHERFITEIFQIKIKKETIISLESIIIDHKVVQETQ